ncbi:MAG TPA: serine/threonine protein kinase, partial [Archangium sp.]|nr:serine/threonine protein kinase [Archangium sp.]
MATDLYGLGVLLYQGLTDMHPFNPELPDEQLVAAIATVPPEPPHLLNPLAPLSLSHIAMKLLEKKPEARYPDTEALLQALGKASDKERKSPAWKVPLTQPGGPAEATLEEKKERIARPPESAQPRADAREEAPPQVRYTWSVKWLAGL